MADGFGDNVLQFLRRRNIFGVPDQIGNDLPSQGGITGRMPVRPTGSIVEDEDDYDPAARMREIYQPETRISDRYYEGLGKMPTRNKPGALRKIAAVVGAFGNRGAENVERALYSPYHRQMQDWQTEIEPLKEGANLERQSNANLRMIANQIVSQEQSDRRIQRQLERDKTLARQGDIRLGQGEERLSQADQRIKQADARLKIATEVARGGQFEVDDVGNAMIIRKDGTTIPVDASYLSAEEKSALRTQEVGAGAAARAANARDRIVERVIEDPDNPGRFIRARVNLDTGDVEPLQVRPPAEPERPVAAPPVSQLEQGREVLQRAQNIKASNPDWAKYVTIKGNTVEITRPGRVFGPSRETYDQLYQQIYGGPPPAERTTTPPARGRGAGPANQRPRTAGAPPAGRIRVIGPINPDTGQPQTGTVSEEDARNLPPGWRRQ